MLWLFLAIVCLATGHYIIGALFMCLFFAAL